ncbi:MAG: hypothetical protein HKN58_03430 [Xanthomonadales bacterium]|nr:hypothetical protein [Xanthomonadales bacterium]
MRKTSSFTLPVILAMLAVVCEAANPVHFEHLGPEDGLSHNTANAIIQDREGFIWIATDDGLDRFDGYEFRHFRLAPAAGNSNVFVRLVEDDAGVLWIGTRSGLLRFDPRDEILEPVTLGDQAEDRELEVTAMLKAPGGEVWIAQGPRLFRAEGGQSDFHQVLDITSPEQAGALAILALTTDPSEHLWFLVGDAAARTTLVARLDAEGSLQRYPLGEWASLGIGFGFDRSGELWLSAGRHPTNIPGARRLPGEISPTMGLNAMVEDDAGTIWLGTTGAGIFRVPPGGGNQAQQLMLGEGWQENYVLDFLIDRAGSVWVSTLAGVARHDPGSRPFRHLGVDDSGGGLSVGAVSSLVQDSDGAVWVGTYGGGLGRWDPATGTVETIRHQAGHPGSLCDDTIWDLHLDQSGALWVAGASAMCRRDPATGTFAPIAPPRNWDRQTDVRVMRGFGPDTVLVGFSILGFWMLDVNTRQWRQLLEVEGQITSLEVMPPDHAWLGFHTGFLVRVAPESGAVTRFDLASPDGRHFKNLNIYDIHHDESGQLWLATDGGLGRFDPVSGAFEYPVLPEELPGTVTFSLERDDAGRLWIGTNHGLARFDPRAPAEERVRLFDLSDGLGNIEFNRRAVFRSASGDMYLGGMTGVTAFHPDAVRLNTNQPSVALTRISVLGKGGERELVPRNVGALTLQSGDQAVAFEFAALSFVATHKNEYAYRLEGLDSDWVMAGQRRYARYAGLAPGEYRFRARGSNNHGVWSEAEVQLPVTVLPAYWQTAWFRGAVVIALLGLLWFAHRYRVRRLLELEKMRLRIASDLHDELSGELSSIALSSAIARRKGYLEESERHRLEEIESTSRHVIGGLRDLVWTINPEHDSIPATVRRMRETASQLLESLEWTFDEDWTQAREVMAMTVRRDLYLVFKEALTNIVRHARATRVSIRLATMDDRLRLEVEDDGAGFDVSASGDGTGLASVRRRARRLGATLDVSSGPGKGTRIRMDLPLSHVRRDGESS